MQAAVLDLAKFGKVVKLEAFVPFKSGANALENINAISEGQNHFYLISEFAECSSKKVTRFFNVGNHKMDF